MMKIPLITLNRTKEKEHITCSLSPQTITLLLSLLQHLEVHKYVYDTEDIHDLINTARLELENSTKKLFFLEQARDSGSTSGTVSLSTIYLAMQGLQLAFDRTRWQVGLDHLSDTEFNESQDLLTTAFDELLVLI